MQELLTLLGIDLQLLFWAFLGSVASIWFGPKNLFLALGSVVVGTVFGTGFATYASLKLGLSPNASALWIGFVGMALGRVSQAAASKVKINLPGSEKNS